MANILDYLKWRGDLSFDKATFNDADNLVLARLAYLKMDGIVPAAGEGFITIGDFADKFLNQEKREVLLGQDEELADLLKDSRRFKNTGMHSFINQVDFKAAKQFAAVVLALDNGESYVAYRGTDNTIAGWREDFNMSFMTPVPAQNDAVFYLREAARKASGPIRVGGHSKGGNLAMFAASFCGEDVQKRIIKVYNNDGPGFTKETLEREGYDRIKPRAYTFVPQSSVVGMLLEHEEEYIIVKSTQSGLMQHDLYSWEVTRDGVVRLSTVDNASKFIDKTLKTWVANMSEEQREQFFNGLFGILNETGAKTLDDLSSHKLESAQKILSGLKNTDDSVKKVISKTIASLIASAASSLITAK